MPQAPDSLTTERLILRRPDRLDAAAIFELGGDPNVTRYMDWRTHINIQDAVDFLEGCAPRWESGEEFCWVITVKPDDYGIGTIACRVDGHSADFGYVLNRRYWGQGYATEAVSAVVNWVTALPEIYRVWATCDAENMASARVLQKSGLQLEGTLRCATIRPNLSPLPRDTFSFAKVKDGGADRQNRDSSRSL